ncbi:ABC-type molybdate transport system substrate-binding protein [Bradyrhizobium sp. i1.7.7]
MIRIAGLFTAFVLLASASLSPAAAEDKTITVFAAASMKNALDEIDAAYTAKTGVKFSVSYAASSVLAKQIEQGAPADVFVSADTDWMDYAISKKSINEPTRVNLLGNSIVLIAPKDSKIDNVTIAQGFDLAKLAGDGKIATGDVKSVAGRQIRQGGAGEAGRMAGCGAEIRHGRERARRADAGGAW